METPESDQIEILFLSLVVEYKICGLGLSVVLDKYISFHYLSQQVTGKSQSRGGSWQSSWSWLLVAVRYGSV